MIKNYIKTAWRSLWKHKSFAFINIVGMAVAFGAVILLALTAFYELSFDGFHQNKNHIYQVYREEHISTGTENSSSLPIPLTPALKADFPDIVHVSRFGDNGGSVIRYKGKDYNYSIRTVDQDFLKMFTFPVISGNSSEPLKAQNDLVLSANTAKSIFGKEEAVGKVVELNTGSEWKPFTITAVAANTPQNSSLNFDALARFEQFPGYNQDKDNWDVSNHVVYLQLPESVDEVHFEQRLKLFVHKYYGGNIKQLKIDGAQPDNEGEYMRMRLIPLTQIHFNKISGEASGINRFYPILLLLISVFILFIATVNFINLSLGRAFTRAKEIGVRKVMGARLGQILMQFCCESLMICIFSLAVGVLLVVWLMPAYKQIFRQPLSLAVLDWGKVICYFVTGFVSIVLLSGAYPAWLMASYKTAQSVKGKISMGRNNKLRNSLMIVQFVLSCLLIICTTIAWQQLNFLRSKPLGFNKNQVISIPIGNNIDREKALYLMRNQLANSPNVLSVTGTDMNMGKGRDNSASTSIMGLVYNGKTLKSHWRRIDYDYVKTLGLTLTSGREFSKAYGTDTTAIVINQTMAQQLGAKNPVGISLPVDGKQLRVIGVIKDFNFQPLQKKIEPLTMLIQPQWQLSYIFVRVKPDDMPASMAAITKIWKQINPKAEAAASFLDENVDRQYKKEERLSKIFVSGALLTIIISCMGLFAIAVLVITQRTKELGIRKVLGASIPTIVGLISKDFVTLILISSVIASPIAWLVMNNWLQDFAYRITISWWVFVFAAATAVFIAIVTVSFQSVKAALANPVKSLRSE
ncbi:MacB-like protein [Mucilaginibacter gracilis]|uniref:MacB-like protein n=1 Tax=Mucilaginibacter gracilis TaxID=423350 RepID=A0A495JCD9_9SPHI|nr:ABC transporter permease [Mucilaginibacter gracilis]RKR85729.1 MacB-like protein [Mucilaginibacter gracilis]